MVANPSRRSKASGFADYSPTTTSLKSLLVFGLLILAFGPIAWLATWCARNAPFDYVSSVFRGESLAIGKITLVDRVDQVSGVSGRVIVYSTNLDTEKTASTSFPFERYVGNGVDGNIFWSVSPLKEKKLFAMRRFDVAKNQLLATTLLPIDFGDPPLYRIVLKNNRIFCMTNDRLETYDSDSGQLLDSLSYAGSPKTFPIADALPPNCVILTDSTTKSILVQIGPLGKLQILGEWDTIDWFPFQDDDKYLIACLLPDGMTIEIRNAVDGTLVSTTTLAPDPSLPTPLRKICFGQLGSWISHPSISGTLDVFTGRSLPVPGQFKLIARDRQNNRLVAVSNNTNRRECTYIVLDELTGNELTRFETKPGFGGIKFLSDSHEIAFTMLDLSVLIYDARNGQLIRTIDPYRWVRWSRILVGIAFAFWCTWWVRFFARIHPHGWVDTTVCFAVLLSYMTYCSYYDASFRPTSYLYMMALGILVGLIFLSCIWLVLGRMRLSIRVSPLLLTFGLSVGCIVWWTVEAEARTTEAALLPSVFAVTVGLVSLLLPLRLLGFRYLQVAPNSENRLETKLGSQTRIDLKDLFLFTSVCAVFFSISRWIPLTQWYEFVLVPRNRTQLFVIVGIHFVLFAGLGLFGLWISMSRRRGLWVNGCLASFALCLLGFWFFESWRMYAYLPTGTYFTCLLGFYAYRIRGWRLVSRTALN